MPAGQTAGAVILIGAILIAQIILPATIDLICSVALIAAGGWCGWKAAKAA